jgi:succinylarginine dihydrolase
MKGRGRTALSVLRGMGYSGNREKVLAQVSADVETKIGELK